MILSLATPLFYAFTCRHNPVKASYYLLLLSSQVFAYTLVTIQVDITVIQLIGFGYAVSVSVLILTWE